MATHTEPKFGKLPVSRLGWWSVGLAVLYSLMGIINNLVFMRLPEETPWRLTVLPYYGIVMLLVGLSAGVVALMAIFRYRERSWLVWLTLVQWAFTLFFIFGEFLIAH